MPIRAYITRDQERNEQPPAYSHEATAALALLQRLHEALHDDPHTYAVISNLSYPRADLVVIGELGVGVVELKHHTGQLAVHGAGWSTEHGPIKAGDDTSGHANPREQVQHYAAQLRKLLLQKCAGWWSLAEPSLARNLHVQTAVCFTHPGMIIPAYTKEAIIDAADADYHRHGQFDLLTPHEFAAWAAALRFDIVEKVANQHRPYRLEQRHIAELIGLLHGVEWSAAEALMPSDRAYAYLIAHTDRHDTAVFALHVLDVVIGRSATHCALTIPQGHGKVSRIHAKLTRYGDQIWLQDLGSSHGTYVNGVRIGQAVFLKPGDLITLGDRSPGPGVYACEFVLRLPDDAVATETVKGYV